MRAEPVAPIYIGPRNAEHVIGQSWRWCRDTARRLGVPVLRVGGKPLIRAVQFAMALERAAELVELTPEQERQAMLDALGMEPIRKSERLRQ